VPQEVVGIHLRLSIREYLVDDSGGVVHVVKLAHIASDHIKLLRVCLGPLRHEGLCTKGIVAADESQHFDEKPGRINVDVGIVPEIADGPLRIREEAVVDLGLLDAPVIGIENDTLTRLLRTMTGDGGKGGCRAGRRPSPVEKAAIRFNGASSTSIAREGGTAVRSDASDLAGEFVRVVSTGGVSPDADGRGAAGCG
jgi:hypothetical protein